MPSFLTVAENSVNFRRPFTLNRVLLHLVFWGGIFWMTFSQFKRSFMDQPNTELLWFVSLHHLLTIIISFIVLGYVAMPYVLYWKRTSRSQIQWIIGVITLYYAFLCVHGYALLMYVHGRYQSLPSYLLHRYEQFEKASLTDYLINPSVSFWIYGHFISYLTIPLLIKALRDSYARSRIQLKIEKEHRQLEVDKLVVEKENTTKDLQFLRQQINPHFLLNAFNNIYVLIHRQDKRAAETLANLSTLIRYALYRTRQDFVPLRDELDFISGYIDMERIRHNQPEAIEYQLVQPTDTSNEWLVPPLLLVTFIENAFKHGLNAVFEGGWVKISMETGLPGEGWLRLMVSNNKSDIDNHHPLDRGIGLANVKRRLMLLFPNEAYELTITDRADQFMVSLTIPLQKKGESVSQYEYTHTMSAC